MRSIPFTLSVILLCLILSTAQAAAEERIILYTSIHEPLLAPLRKAFDRAHPGIRLECLAAGSGAIVERVLAETERGAIVPDVIWITDPARFSLLEQMDIFAPHAPSSDGLFSIPVTRDGGLYTIVCLHTAGIAYNTRLVRTRPGAWSDIFGKEFTGVFGVGDPALSGVAQMSLSLLTRAYGWDFARNLAANKAKMSTGVRLAVDDTATGELAGCLAAGYLVLDRIGKGAPLGYVLPDAIPLIPSVVGLTRNGGGPAGSFVDFLLSAEGQAILAGGGALPVRPDIPLHPGLPVASLAEALERSIPWRYPVPAAETRVAILKMKDIMADGR